MKQLTATKVVRAIMRENGAQYIWTNRYPTCRTVKCYVLDAVDPDKTMREIARSLNANDVPFTTKLTKGAPYPCYEIPGIIVRIPNDKDNNPNLNKTYSNRSIGN